MVGKHRRTPSAYEESWEPDVADRIRKIVLSKETLNPASVNPLCMVALAGIPGSGKTISGFLLANILEKHGIETMVMPHDGYHFSLEYLKTFPDAEDAIYRRGAPFTFNPQALLRDLLLIKGNNPASNDHSENEDSNIINLPGFDHAKGDPEPDVHMFDRSRHKVVICEGLYLLHNDDGWEEIADVFDFKVYIDADVDNCIERLKIRNQCIPGYTPEEIAERCEKVDRVNAMIAVESKNRADLIVKGRDAPVRESEKPPEQTDQQEALINLEQKDIDEAVENIENHDWTMDIMSRPIDISFPARSRSNSLASNQSEPPPPASQFVGTWEPEQAKYIQKQVDKHGLGKTPYMVALVGTPGSGKSVSSLLLSSILEDNGYTTMVCPHDGYHYPLEYLKTFQDADDYVYRRGAPDTFDPKALLRDLGRIRNGDEELIKLPAFDHAKADPEPDTHIFDRRHHKIVLCEGLYLLHDEDGWEEIATMFDYKIFMNSDLEVCVERVKIRNQCIPGYTPEEIEERCEKVDRVNALTVMRSKDRADVIVDSSSMVKH